MKKVLLAEILLVLLLAGVMTLLLYKKEPKDVPLEKIREAVLSECALDGLEEARDMRLKRAFGLSPDDLQEYLYFAPADTLSVNEVLIVKMPDASQTAPVRAAMEERVAAEKVAFDGYGIEQMALLSEAKIVEDGRYVIYACGENAEDFVKAARKVWGR